MCVSTEFLDIWDLDLLKDVRDINKQQHNTAIYSNDNLIVRRGQEFQIKITFNRAYRPADDQFAVEFVLGETPNPLLQPNTVGQVVGSP